ncbi:MULTISPECIES: amidohydrolase [Bizionia]|uniref:Omega-amidase YafV n=1 Tax=Bizionia algoritergicola TaxID=291187 RepID=A0A5D0R195_9FLAO|nr:MULTISPECIES: amidohydrolase [Bizionia]OBX21795.1 amidohydrolase [Bizionia sp. APA-3]TYB74859.1 amidohydrolase [Bizionia algoritergicola]
MRNELNLAIIQTHLVWEDPKANREHFKTKIQGIKQPVDLIVLPEMFTTGFTMNAQAVAETMDGKTVTWMQKHAAESGAAITGSLIIEENDNFYNRMVFAFPDGTLKTYDKRHSFTLVGEEKVFTAGQEKVIVNYKDWKICLQICYDLRFPVWARNTTDYDALIYVANWPKPRVAAWDALLKARAIENMCYCIGVNRVGEDDAQNEYSGHSAVYDVLGNNITPIRPNKDHIELITLDKTHINRYRTKLKFLNDRDQFKIM